MRVCFGWFSLVWFLHCYFSIFVLTLSLIASTTTQPHNHKTQYSQQTILYVTLRVAKEEYTREALQADLKQSSRANNSEYAPINVGDDDEDDEEGDGFGDEGGNLEMQNMQASNKKQVGLLAAVPE